MPVLPIPMMFALLLTGFLIQRFLTRETHFTILALIGICAVQAVIISLVQYYGFNFLRSLQAVAATTIPPIAWAAFVTAAGGDIRVNKLVWHALGPALAFVCLWLHPYALDALIPLAFLTYGIAMLLRLRRGEDGLLHSRLDSGSNAVLAWRILAFSLIASAICDVVIAYSMAQGLKDTMLWLPSIISSISLLSLGVLSLTNDVESRREDDIETISEEDTSRDHAIIAALDQYLVQHKPYLDPDLTLARLARKLVVPAKQLSAAINRSKNENVSRFINRYRIDHACALIAEGNSVTTAMYDSGFNTKSNFNREFLRIKNMAPSKWKGNS